MSAGRGALPTVAELVEEAVARHGGGARLDDVPFTETLSLLVDSCRRGAALNDAGRTVLHKAAVRRLRNLLALRDHVHAHPDTARRALDGVLVVTGMPRTGTTLLHNLLALDPAHRALRLWEALRPVPVAPDGPEADALRAQAAGWLEAFYRLVPDFPAIHRATATGPEECDALLQNTFASQHFDDMFDAPDYSAWLAAASLAAEYEHYAVQLRALSATSPPGTTWALKSPSHLGHLDALRAAVPGCTVVVCHRTPHAAVASYASLVLTLRRPYGEAASARTAGRQALARSATAMARAMAVRDSCGGAGFVDVSYARLVADPLGAVAELYRDAGRTLTDEAAGRMRRWVADNPQHKHGPHPYAAVDFGLSGEEVDAAFGAYLERFADALSG